MADRIQVRRDTATNWTSADPTLAQGEIGYETDTDKVKIGDGSTAWTSLGYVIDTGDYLLSSDIGSTVQAYSSVLQNTTASFTTADETKLDGIETGADVTDTANVTAAGALMDSELTDIASVKALNQGVATTDTPTFAGLTLSDSNPLLRLSDTDGTNTYSDIAHSGSGLYLSARNGIGAGPIIFRGLDAGLPVEYGRFTQQGRLGIGTSSPSTLLHVNGDTTLGGGVTETVYALSGTTPALDPSNGTVQTWTLTGNSTPTDSLSAGEAITLMIDDGTAYTITWPTMTWVNNGGSAPTLATTGYTVIALWKVSTTLYGALVGDGS